MSNQGKTIAIPHSSIQIHPTKNLAFDLLATVFILTVGAVLTFYSTRIMLNFDGAYNAQVAVSLASGQGYATLYDGGKLFDPYITTGPTVLFPAALAIMLFGVETLSVQVTSIFYSIGLLFIIYRLVSHTTNRFLGLLAIITIVSMASYDLLSGLLGEVPALFFFCSAVLFFNSKPINGKMLFVIGLFFGFSLLTKIIFAAVIAPVAVYFLWLLLKKNLSIKDFILFFAGVAVPSIVFEIYKLVVLSPRGYYRLTRDTLNAMRDNVGEVSHSFQLLNRMDIIVDQLSVSIVLLVIILVLCLLVFGMAFYRAFIKKEFKQQDISYFLISIGCIAFIFYWVILSSAIWARRLEPFLQLGILVAFYALYEISNVFLFQPGWGILNGVKQPFWNRFANVLLPVALSVLVILTCFPARLRYMEAQASDFQNAMQMVNYVNQLPEDEVVLGYGWWQAPSVSLMSGRTFYSVYGDNYFKHLKQDTVYLVQDNIAFLLVDAEFKRILEKYDHQLEFTSGNYAIYRLKITSEREAHPKVHGLPASGQAIIDTMVFGEKYIVVSGWGFINVIDPVNCQKYVFLEDEHGKRYYETQTVIRQDVTQSLKKDVILDHSGFKAIIRIDTPQLANVRIGLLIVDPVEGKFAEMNDLRR